MLKTAKRTGTAALLMMLGLTVGTACRGDAGPSGDAEPLAGSPGAAGADLVGDPRAASSAASSPPGERTGANRLTEGRRDDLARFRFKYAEEGGSGRELWISETCYNSGVLRAVPRWGDETPWVFQSISEGVFEQVEAPAGTKPVRLEFELHHGHGGILGLVVSGGATGRFEQGGYLPEGFEPEMGTCD